MNRQKYSRGIVIYSGTIIFWIIPAARLLLTILAFDYPKGNSLTLLDMAFSAWAFWAVATFLASILGHPVHKRWSRILAAVDVSFATAILLLDPGLGIAFFAFAVSVAAAQASRFEYNVYIISSLAVPALAWAVGDNLLTYFLGSNFDPMRMWNGPLNLTMVILAILSATLVSVRRGYLEKFRDVCTGLKSRLSGEYVYHELQEWVDKLAQLYEPNRALIALGPVSDGGRLQVTDHALSLDLPQEEQRELVEALQRLPKKCRVMDSANERCFIPLDRDTRPCTEDEKIIADFLKKVGINIAIVQRVQVDRQVGGVICAVDAQPTPSLIAECPYLCGLFVETAGYLDHKSKQERNFIADAHEVARRDLHDGVLQTLAALRMRLSALAKGEELRNSATQLDLHKILSIITLEQSRLRSLLEADASDSKVVNLVPRLDVCLRGVSLQWEMSVELLSDEPAIAVCNEFALNIENLLREVIANAARHSGSRALTVALSLEHDALILVVRDLATGQKKSGSKKRASLPLESASLRHRLQLVDGEAYAVGLNESDLLAIRVPMEQISDA